MDFSEVQDIIDWIVEQADIRNYPNFGEYCEIDDMRVTTENPRLNSVDTQTTPPLAKYSFTIQVDYLDTSKKIYNKS
jgi:hypothetical protein